MFAITIVLLFSLVACQPEKDSEPSNTQQTENLVDDNNSGDITENEQTTFGINPNTSNIVSALGANVEPYAPWSPTLILTDIFPKTMPWRSVNCMTDAEEGSLARDAAQWVAALDENQCADSFVLTGLGDSYPGGTYVLLWEGKGIFSVAGDLTEDIVHTTSEETEVTNASLNRITFDVVETERAEGGIYFRISETTAGNYIRNMRLIPPGGVCGKSATELDYFAHCATDRGGVGSCPTTQQCYDFEDVYWDRFNETYKTMNTPRAVFHPQWLAKFRKYRAIRYMKWTRAEDNMRVGWNSRVGLRTQSFVEDESGWPYEYTSAMSNILNADVWVNIPMMASNDYAGQLANFYKGTLNSNLKIYFEYGNENFNTLQAVPYTYALQQANEMDSGIPSTDEDMTKVAKFSIKRTAEISGLWDAAFGKDKERLTSVFPTFTVMLSYAQDALGFENYVSQIDALSPAGYIAPDRRFADNVTVFDAMSKDDILQEVVDGSVVDSGADLVSLNSRYVAHKALADQYNLKMIAYEGGSHMVGSGGPDSLVAAMIEANRDVQMGTHLATNLNNWKSAGGEIWFHFLVFDLWNEDGMFGLYEHQAQSTIDAPKAYEILNWINQNPCWWDGCQRANKAVVEDEQVESPLSDIRASPEIDL